MQPPRFSCCRHGGGCSRPRDRSAVHGPAPPDRRSRPSAGNAEQQQAPPASGPPRRARPAPSDHRIRNPAQLRDPRDPVRPRIRAIRVPSHPYPRPVGISDAAHRCAISLPIACGSPSRRPSPLTSSTHAAGAVALQARRKLFRHGEGHVWRDGCAEAGVQRHDVSPSCRQSAARSPGPAAGGRDPSVRPTRPRQTRSVAGVSAARRSSAIVAPPGCAPGARRHEQRDGRAAFDRCAPGETRS